MITHKPPYEWHLVEFYVGVPTGTELPSGDFGSEFFEWLTGPDEKAIDDFRISGRAGRLARWEVQL